MISRTARKAMDTEALASAIMSGDRRALARAITLVESAREDHQEQASELLGQLTTATSERQAPKPQALRIGLTGAPGVGKSSFIEAFGLYLTGLGKTLAVLAVDPSSQRSGGSLLGDKTRMEQLSRDPRAFIRPSPSGAQLGGIARRSREVIALCEAAGFDVILLETVGTGQSETMAAGMVDVFALLIGPGGGDDLQGVKRGIMEHADLVLITKADGDLRAQARATRADYAAALRLLRPREKDPPGFPQALTVSAHDGSGLAEAWQAITRIADWRQEQGLTAQMRADQARAAFRDEVTALLLARLVADPTLAERIETLESAVASGSLTPLAAARQAVAQDQP